MDLGRPLRVVTPTLDGDVLVVLARAHHEFTPPEITALIADRSVEGVRNALLRLVEQGIVLRRPAGQAWLYQLNREHLAAPAIIALASLYDTFLDDLRQRVESWAVPCVYAALFGSAARGHMKPESDIDVFVVRSNSVDPDDDTWSWQLQDLAHDASRWTGNDIRVLEIGENEVRSGLAAGERVLVDIAEEGIRLAGPSSYLRTRRRETHGRKRTTGEEVHGRRT